MAVLLTASTCMLNSWSDQVDPGDGKTRCSLFEHKGGQSADAWKIIFSADEFALSSCANNVQLKVFLECLQIYKAAAVSFIAFGIFKS